MEGVDNLFDARVWWWWVRGATGEQCCHCTGTTHSKEEPRPVAGVSRFAELSDFAAKPHEGGPHQALSS